MENKPASLLVVPLGKALSGIPPSGLYLFKLLLGVDFPDMFVHSVPDVCMSQRSISLL